MCDCTWMSAESSIEIFYQSEFPYYHKVKPYLYNIFVILRRNCLDVFSKETCAWKSFHSKFYDILNLEFCHEHQYMLDPNTFFTDYRTLLKAIVNEFGVWNITKCNFQFLCKKLIEHYIHGNNQLLKQLYSSVPNDEKREDLLCFFKDRDEIIKDVCAINNNFSKMLNCGFHETLCKSIKFLEDSKKAHQAIKEMFAKTIALTKRESYFATDYFEKHNYPMYFYKRWHVNFVDSDYLKQRAQPVDGFMSGTCSEMFHKKTGRPSVYTMSNHIRLPWHSNSLNTTTED